MIDKTPGLRILPIYVGKMPYLVSEDAPIHDEAIPHEAAPVHATTLRNPYRAPGSSDDAVTVVVGDAQPAMSIASARDAIAQLGD
ncbi:MAG: hypothetical protein QM811_27175 [Pirellulales bacterium]